MSTLDISNYSVLARPPLHETEINPYNAYFFNNEICRILSIAYGTDGRRISYITANEDRKEVDFETFRQNATFFARSNLDILTV